MIWILLLMTMIAMNMSCQLVVEYELMNDGNDLSTSTLPSLSYVLTTNKL